MSTYTSRFNLFKYDTTADAKSAFSITQALNNNWDALDLTAVKRGTTAAIGNSSTPVYVDATGTIQPCSYSIPTSSGLTATTSLAENGYIKFSNDVLFQWGDNTKANFAKGQSTYNISYPISFTSFSHAVICYYSTGTNWNYVTRVGISENGLAVFTVGVYTSNTANQAAICLDYMSIGC